MFNGIQFNGIQFKKLACLYKGVVLVLPVTSYRNNVNLNIEHYIYVLTDKASA